MNPEENQDVKKYDYKTKANPEDVELDDNDDITDKEQRETSYALGQTMNITPDTKKLYLSGTPYDLMADEKFVDEDIIARFGFKDLMQAKKEWDDAAEKQSQEWIQKNEAKKDAWFNMSEDERRKWIESHPDEKPFEDDNSNPYRKEKNPYFGIPKMITMGYKMDKMHLDKFCDDGVFKFKLFLETEKINGGKGRRFINEKQVLKLFRIIDGAEHDGDLMTILDVPAFKKGDMLKNIVIVLPYRRCCDAFEQMMLDYRDKTDENGRPMFKHLGDYVIIKATSEIDKSIDPDFAKDEVLRNVERGNNTITLTVGRLMTGVTVKPWDTMFYMRDLNKAQEYDQAKFRIQTPYVKEVSTLDIDDTTGKLEKTKEPTLIDMKPQTLFVDFSPRRMFDLTKRRIFAHSGACKKIGENTKIDHRGVYGLIEDEIESEKDFLPVALMENGSIRECTSLDVANYIKDLQKDVKISKRLESLKKWPKPSDAAILLMKKVKPASISKKMKEKIDAILGETDATKEDIEAAKAILLKGGELPKSHPLSKRKVIKCSESDREKLQKVFVNQMETIMKDIFMFLILKNDDTDVPDFHRLWDAMTHIGSDGRNYELVYNIFFEDLGIEDKGSLEDNAYAIKDALQEFVRVYLAPNQKVEEFIEMMYQTQKEFRTDIDAYTNLKEELKEFGGRLDKSEIITPDDTLKEICKDLVIFKDGKVLDCYCSKIGEVPYYLSTDPKFKDDFDVDNYYMICRTGMIAELNRPVIQMLYAKKYPYTKKDEKDEGKFSLKDVTATNKFMRDHIIITNQKIDHSEDEVTGEGDENDMSEVAPTVEGTPENSSFVNLKSLEHFIKESTGDDEETNDIITKIKKKWCKEGMIQFDTVIGNPPYSGSLHLDIIESVLPFMSGRSTGCFIHPATWLINVRKNGKAKQYNLLKDKLNGHIKSINLENLNKKFNTTRFDPYCITNIDMTKKYTNIDFTFCGEHKIVDTLYDCNLIGNYNDINDILEKVKSYGDMMKDHITNKDMGDEYWYAKFEEKNMLPLCQMETDRVGKSYENSSNNFIKTKNGEFYSKYFTTAIHYIDQEPSSSPLCRRDRGKHITDIIDWNVYGTENEIKNWKHFIFNNKLPLFINIVITISQDNPNKEYLPWLVDKQYTDEEINEKFGFTKDEIKLIDDTLKKFERHSPWFKRYICGREDPNKVTTMEESPKRKKKETPVEPDSSPSSSEYALPKSIYDLDLEKLKPDAEESEKYKEQDLKDAYPDQYDRYENSSNPYDYSFRYWLYKKVQGED